jgi:hypothetical protein
MGVIVPRFGKQAKRQLAKETGLEYSSEFWLNKYFEKELTLLCHSHPLNVLIVGRYLQSRQMSKCLR